MGIASSCCKERPLEIYDYMIDDGDAELEDTSSASFWLKVYGGSLPVRHSPLGICTVRHDYSNTRIEKCGQEVKKAWFQILGLDKYEGD
jgi:hypothetical protein